MRYVQILPYKQGRSDFYGFTKQTFCYIFGLNFGNHFHVFYVDEPQVWLTAHYARDRHLIYMCFLYKSVQR